MTPEIPLCPCQLIPVCPCPPEITPILNSEPMDSFSLCLNRMSVDAYGIRHVFFSVWPLPFVPFLRFIHVVVCVSRSFLVTANSCS